METDKLKERLFETVDNGGQKVKLICVRPNQDVLDGAKLEYNVVFAKAVRAHCLVRMEVEEMIESRHLLAKDEVKVNEMKEVLQNLELKLGATSDNEEGKEIAKKMIGLRTSINDIIIKHNSLYNKTAESLAEAAQNQYLVVRCILAENKQPYFTSLDKFKELESSQLLSDCLSELMLFLMNITSDEIVATTENKWLIDKKLIDSKTGFWLAPDGTLLDDLGRKVDKDGNLVVDIQPWDAGPPMKVEINAEVVSV